MPYFLLALFVIALTYGPFLWVRFVLWKNSRDIPDLPGTGAELAVHLIEKFSLDNVKVLKGKKGENYYSPDEKIVSLSPDVYDGKSVTAVSVAAHEVGHAIQFCREEPVSKLRVKYLGRAHQIKKVGSYIIMSIPFITILVKSPAVFFVLGLVGLATMLVSVFMYVAILPEEYDASFKKALPILKEGYLPKQYIPKANSVLKACAMTYVAAALSDVLSLWRWARYLR